MYAIIFLPIRKGEIKMDFVPAIKTCLTKYIDIKGRASRSEYWWFILFCFIVLFAANLINRYLPNIVSLLLLCPIITAQVRRLHDGDRTGWWALIGIIPIVNLVLLYFLIIEGTKGPNQFGNPAV